MHLFIVIQTLTLSGDNFS